MSGDWTPVEIASYDQALAGTDTELDQLVEVLRTETDKVGERQALANVGKLVASRNDHGTLVGLLMASLRRLSSADGPQ